MTPPTSPLIFVRGQREVVVSNSHRHVFDQELRCASAARATPSRPERVSGVWFVGLMHPKSTALWTALQNGSVAIVGRLECRERIDAHLNFLGEVRRDGLILEAVRCETWPLGWVEGLGAHGYECIEAEGGERVTVELVFRRSAI